LTEVDPPAQPRSLAAARRFAHLDQHRTRPARLPRRRRTWSAGRRFLGRRFLGRRFLLAAWVDKATAIGVTPTRALAVTTRRGNRDHRRGEGRHRAGDLCVAKKRRNPGGHRRHWQWKYSRASTRVHPSVP